jgi:IS5 family transposase
MRRLAGLRLIERLPDETTILNFRHFLEQHGLGKELFKAVNQHLERNGLMLREGSIVDATIIQAPSSTKNQSGKRDPEMHQTKKGNQWYFGMKMHIGVDDVLGLIHSIDTTQANTHDILPKPRGSKHKSEPRSSTRSGTSSGCLAMKGYATADWRKTPTGFIFWPPSATC